MSLPCIGILVPMGARTPQLPPEALPFGRAALAARARGLDVVLGAVSYTHLTLPTNREV